MDTHRYVARTVDETDPYDRRTVVFVIIDGNEVLWQGPHSPQTEDLAQAINTASEKGFSHADIVEQERRLLRIDLGLGHVSLPFGWEDIESSLLNDL